MPTPHLSLRRHAQLLLAVALTVLLATWLLAADALAATPGASPKPSPTPTGEDTPLNLPTDSATSGGSSGGGGLARTIVGLFVVIAVIYGVTWVLKQLKASKEGDAYGAGLESAASLPLGPGRALHLVGSPSSTVTVRWHEPAPGFVTTTVKSQEPIQARNVAIDLSRLVPDHYTLTVSVTRAGQTASATREFEILPP